MAAKLVAEEGLVKGLVLSLEDGDQWIIGRDPDACQLLIEDSSASRKHLVCRTTPEGILVENLSTTNPIQVNDEEVSQPRLLQNGDLVKIGDGIFRFYAEAAAQLIKETTEDSTITTNGEEQPASVSLPSAEPGGKTPNDEELPMPVAQGPVAQEEEKSVTAPNTAPDPADLLPPDEDEGTERRDTIFDEEPNGKSPLAEINFSLLDTGRWLLKVIGGPNNGAEFSMQSGVSYVIGTDPNICDIVFHDNSVSRQHARITISAEDALTIEDLKSRNGTLLDGDRLTGKRSLNSNTVISLGTTSFIVIDREGEMQTIISPLMPSIVKELQKEEAEREPKPPSASDSAPTPEGQAAAAAPSVTEGAPLEGAPQVPEHHHMTTFGAFILIAILTGLFVVVGIGTSTLFRSEPVTVTQTVDPYKALDSALAAFPSVKYTFNKTTGQLLLVGHVLANNDRSQLLYALQGLTFIKNLDDSGIVIDEYVWREINQVIEKNPDWKGITVIATSPGHFVVSGYLQTRGQADRLSDYLSNNFPYPDLLEKRVIVDEDVVSAINNVLETHGFKNVKTKLDNGEVILTGLVPIGKTNEVNALVNDIRDIRGVRNVRNLVAEVSPEESMINISDKYDVSGFSNQGGNLSVVINGRILMKGDVLDGMTITNIQPNAVFLIKENTHYRIDFQH